MRFMGEVNFPHTQEGYGAAQIEFAEKYYPMLTDQQKIIVGQLACAIVEGPLSPKDADMVIKKDLEGCRQSGVSGEIIQAVQEFGRQWAKNLYPDRA
ncbi:MAG: hypothetical protein A2784_02540 [Candidatus Chisholmbacteria bacterium RIFCSPHIGHO2_01_FULL_48_12]|uniref:Uncharacterized protein n=1 Tax=Candidatus Chisholmbacteria bacterium RIFCSPHIGHO2_01_FULL_48_12 TaxID=1797589 RepID=A0A1G1VUU5_9BACT|nr:MAG: hypothetical protein A2784_02540 [Candidatus Chisholmbacteria bacterium RIFCSPHIGHO2_01_FULL_48_12]